MDVLIVGAGPAGIAAALELKKLGIKDVVVAERESEAGGIPRMCGHIGCGIRDLHRLMTGPSYARKYREMAEQAGIKIHTETTITGWSSPFTPNPSPLFLDFTSPDGLGAIEARSVLLATGVRERPWGARLVPGIVHRVFLPPAHFKDLFMDTTCRWESAPSSSVPNRSASRSS